MTLSAPCLCISPANAGVATASIADPRMGVDIVTSPTEKSVSTISGFTVIVPGDMATSSNP